MRNLVRKFNEHTNIDAKMTPITYVRQKSNHQRPHNSYRQTFKIIDLDGSEQQKLLALDAISALTYHDAIQLLQEQPSQNELHFWVNVSKYTHVLKNTWSLAIGNAVVRLGPAHFSKCQFRLRNKFVGQSTAAASFSDAHLLSNLEPISVKDVYRKNIDNTDVIFLVFDTSKSYASQIGRNTWLGDVNLKISPQEYHISSNNSFNSRQTSSHNTKLSSSSLPPSTSPEATGANRTPIGQIHNDATGANRIPLGQSQSVNFSSILDRPQRS